MGVGCHFLLQRCHDLWLKNRIDGDRGGGGWQQSKTREWHKLGIEVGMSKDYLGVEEQFIFAGRFVESGGTSFGMVFLVSD